MCPLALQKSKTRNSCELRVKILCAGKDSNLRRPKSGDLQSPLVDHLSTDASKQTLFSARLL